MRKIIICLILVLVFVLTIFSMVKGIPVLKINGIPTLSQKNKDIEDDIYKLSTYSGNLYAEAEDKLKKSSDTLLESKSEYETQYILSTSNHSSYASNLEAYDIEYLWTRIGNYAKDENVTISMDVTSVTLSTNLYNLNFVVRGEYVDIINFIYDIENDSKFGFKIDDFSMHSKEAKFICKDIPINVEDVALFLEQNSRK